MRISAFCLAFFCLSFTFQDTFAQVTVSINSGNPAFPFPQFMDYASDRQTLASHNPIGVTHAEMEQRMRDAWQIFANSFAYTGKIVGGVKYVKGNVGCPYDCTEGDGYALLAAAYMADKTTFDGLWMRTHDLRMIKYPRYADCVVPNASYMYGQNTLMDSNDSAGDGDFDIALALLIAWKQWGDNMGINDACGNPISYKTEALRVMRGLVEITDHFNTTGDCRRVSGDIGFDGYVKGGNTWGELTNWASNASPCPEFKGPNSTYFDYSAPAYFHAFAKISQEQNEPQWNISQFQRAEASSDWLMGKLMASNQAAIPFVGKVSLTDTTPAFSSFDQGEDFRAGWRTILNYVWHGNSSMSWDPANHVVLNKANTFEKDVAIRFSRFLKRNQDSPWNNSCQKFGPSLSFSGPSTLKMNYSILGQDKSTLTTNWIQGAGSPSAVAAQDFDLMAKMFRQCVIEWDVTTAGDNYLTSVPSYFDGWFRLLGMLVLTGNAPSPLNMVATANLKVYHSVDKTTATAGDMFTFKIAYRNYGSLTATNTSLKFDLPLGIQFVSANKGGTLVGNSVNWNIGTVSGFKSGGLSSTFDSVWVSVRVLPSAYGRLCGQATISCANGTGGVSNEYPNHQTAVMERNCVDIQPPSLYLTKTTNGSKFNPGQDITFKLNIRSGGPSLWVNGGRPGVNLSFAHEQMADPAASSQNKLKLRLFHDAHEAYIDYSNYRVSYFMSDPILHCLINSSTCPQGWAVTNEIAEGFDPSKSIVFIENGVAGSDVNGNWNQRLVIGFSPQLATTTQHLSEYYGASAQIHQGAKQSLRATWRINAFDYSPVNSMDDWSWGSNFVDQDGGIYYPIGDDYTNPINMGIPVTSWHQSACTTATQTTNKVLVEEWDGYTWRRVFGNGPYISKPLTNVVMTDTLPVGLTFKNFIRQSALGVSATTSLITGNRTVVTWSIPVLNTGSLDSIVYTATLGGSCPANDQIINGRAWIQSSTGNPVAAIDSITSVCGVVTGWEIANSANDRLTLYPNPAKEMVTLKSALYSSKALVSIKDLRGNVVMAPQAIVQEEMNVAGLPSGMYWVEVSEGGNVSRVKLMVIK